MSDIKRLMPLLDRHRGVWDGWYRYYGAHGAKVGEHRSRLICRFPDDGPLPYHHTDQ